MKFNSIKLFLFVIIWLSITHILPAKEPFYIDFDWESVKHYNDFQKDFFYLCQLLEESHPLIYEEIPRTEFIVKKNLFAGSLELVVNHQKFAVMLQNFVSQFNDGHTQIYYANGFGNLRVPVKFAWSGDELFISNVNRGLDINLIGCKVHKIGKMPANVIEQKLGPYVSAENRYWRRHQLSELMNLVGFLLLTEVIDHENSIELEIENNEQRQFLKLINQTEVSWLQPLPHPVTAYNNKLFSYILIPEDNICYFQFNEFLDLQTAKMYKETGLVNDSNYDAYHKMIENKGGDFRIFLERMFTDIYQNQIDNLVVDLRYNGGGNSILANQFFDHIHLDNKIIPFTTGIQLSQLMQHYYPDTVDYYLNLLSNNFGIEAKLPYYYDFDLEMKKDYFSIIRNKESGFYLPESNHKFAGKLFFLIGNATFSSAGDMVTIAYDNNIATVIGEPMGQKPTSYGDILYFTLPHSIIEGSVSHKVFKRPKRSLSYEKTIVPDILVKENPREKYLQGIDAAWNTVLKIIRSLN